MHKTYDSINVDFDNRGVATVTLCREQKHNAFDDQMIQSLIEIFSEIANSSAKVMLLAARGKSFSAGADLGWMKRMIEYDYDENLRDARALAHMMKMLNTMPMVTIAKVNGGAFGGALGLICCCDIAVGSEKSMFCLSEVKMGLIPATISPYVVAAIGQRAARRYFQTAEFINAQQALRIGLLSELVNSEELDMAVENLIKQLLKNGPDAIKAAKQLISDVDQQIISDELIEETSKRIATIRTSDEGQEGLQAFLEKRAANWLIAEE